MNPIKKLLALTAIGFAAMQAQAQNARVQVIHNAPDPAVKFVDVWADVAGMPMQLLNNFEFRTATSYINLPAGVDIRIGFADSSSQNISDTISGLGLTVNLTANETYVVLAQGNVGSGFASNPDGVNNGFGLNIFAGARETANTPGNVDFIINHGSPDAITVDVKVQGTSTLLADDIRYLDFAPYVSVPQGRYILDVTPGNSNFAAFTIDANLNGLAGGSAVVFASGYLDPSANNNGPAFGIFAALADGSVVQLSQPTTKVQVIHNSADPAAASVDVYATYGLTSVKVLDDFNFRSATPFVDLPAKTDLTISFAAANSTSIADTLAGLSTTVNLDTNVNYVVFARGVIGTGFAANPDAISTAFGLSAFVGQTSAVNSNNFDLAVFHGSTDAPAIDAYVQGLGQVVNDLAYTSNTAYLNLPAGTFFLDVTASNSTTPLFTYEVNTNALLGQSGVAFASGFLNPSANNNGESFGLFVALANGTVVELSVPTTKVQVIHNSADPAAASVDVYATYGLTSVKVLDDFNFRSATPFVDLPAKTDLTISFAAANSTSIADTLAGLSTTVNLDTNVNYVVFARGVIGTGFAANPDAISTAFGLSAFVGQTSAVNSNNFDLAVFHGSTDAPAIDAYVQGLGQVVNDLAYTSNTAYLNLPAGTFFLDVTASNSTTPLFTYEVNTNALLGQSGVAFASGFLNPSANNNGESFGLFVALANGTVVELSVPTTKVQVIHNSADPAAASVDVYATYGLTSVKVLDDFNFRSATPFVDLPAKTDLTISFAAANSTSIADTLAGLSTTVNLDTNVNYVVFARGVIGTGFAANPNGISTEFGLSALVGQTTGANPNNFDLAVFHGSTDAPAIDAYIQGVGQVVNDAAYTDVVPYQSLPQGAFYLDLTLSNSTTSIFTYSVNTTGLGGQAGIVFASGFLDPDANNNGEEFGLFLALANGTVVELEAPTALVQAIHNSAAPGAASVDVYASFGLNTFLLIDDFNFRTATPFVDVPAQTPVYLAIAPANSTSIADSIAGLGTIVTLEEGNAYTLMAIGNVGTGFAANPDGVSTAFRLLAADNAPITANSGSGIDIRVIHGSTDAPTVDVEARGVALLVDNARFGDVYPTFNVPSNTYTLDVKTADGNTIVKSYSAPLSGFNNVGLTVFASGYLDSTTNNNGAAFGLFAVSPQGLVIALPEVASNVSTQNITLNSLNAYPNPASEFVIVKNYNEDLLITDMAGKAIRTVRAEVGSSETRISVADLPNGVYFISSINSIPVKIVVKH